MIKLRKAYNELMRRLHRFLYGWTPLYWLRTHTINRYHLLDLRGQGDYTWGYLDPCHKMWLACFAILCDFVENESPTVGLNGIDAYYKLGPTGRPLQIQDGSPSKERDWWEHEKESILAQVAREKEIRAVYEWWKNGRAEEHRKLDKMLVGMNLGFNFIKVEGTDYSSIESKTRSDDPKWVAWKKRNEELERKDEKMLQRLIKVRIHLWT